MISPAQVNAGGDRMAQTTKYEQHKDLVRRIVDDMFNVGKVPVAAEIFAPNFIERGHETQAGKTGGPEGFAHFVTAIRSALPDIRATIHNMIAEGDYVAMWNTATATHRGGSACRPSGKQIVMKTFKVFSFLCSRPLWVVILNRRQRLTRPDNTREPGEC